MIIWPAIIKYSGQHELFYISDELDWNSNCNLQRSSFGLGDLLIDSDGMSYDLTDVREISLLCSTGSLNLGELTELVRYHASELGHCCVSKLGFSSIATALEGVASFEEV